jgi:hypothetical protein
VPASHGRILAPVTGEGRREMAGELKKRVRDPMRKIDAKDWDSLNQM